MPKLTKPPHEPTRATRDLVAMHAMVGTTQAVIADIIGIDIKTLCKHYRQELDNSKAKANATIGGALFNKAKGGDTAAMIFWMKTQARWRETGDITEKTEAPPLTINFSVKPSQSDIKVTRGT
jgi:hypothetical protein